MKRALVPLLLVLAMSTGAIAQEGDPPSPPSAGQTGIAPPPEKRSWFSRLNPFRGERLPEYEDPALRGLVLTVQVSPQPIKLSETRQMEVRVRLTNKSKRPITLDFPNAQRFEIYLRNTGEAVLTTWSDNHAFAEMIGTVFINPQEHIEYAETIATRELTPNRVFICEVFFPKYRELRIRQKFLTAP